MRGQPARMLTVILIGAIVFLCGAALTYMLIQPNSRRSIYDDEKDEILEDLLTLPRDAKHRRSTRRG